MLSLALAPAVIFALEHPALRDTRTVTREPAHGLKVQAIEGNFSVAEDRRAEDARRLELPFRVTNPQAAEAVFYFEGGPGISNLKFEPSPELLREFAFVQLGYRGIDGPVRFDCHEVRGAIGTGAPLSEASRNAISDAFAACLDRLAQTGMALDDYTIDEVVRDVESFRKILGYERIHLLANSYGTRVALLYATAYPNQVSRVVLVGANPPGNFYWTPENTSRVLERYDRYLASAVPELAGKPFEQVVEEVLANAPPRAFGMRVDRDRLRIMTFVLLFHRSTADWILDAYLDAWEDGDYTGLATISFAYGFAVPGLMEWGDYLVKGISADANPDIDYDAELKKAGGGLGSPLSELFFTLPVAERIPRAYSLSAPLAISAETLVLAGELDLSTPAFVAREQLEAKFASVRVLEVPGYGHVGDFWKHREVTGRVVAAFLKNRTVEPSAFAPLPMKLRGAWTLGNLVRGAAGVAGILVAGAALLLLL